MQVNPYLFYTQLRGSAELLAKVLGPRSCRRCRMRRARRYAVAADWKTKIMHSRITVDGEVLMASDATPGDYHQPQGISVALAVEDPADAERRFNALAEGGTVRMPFGKTFFSNGFGMCVDKFGIGWMVNIGQATA